MLADSWTSSWTPACGVWGGPDGEPADRLERDRRYERVRERVAYHPAISGIPIRRGEGQGVSMKGQGSEQSGGTLRRNTMAEERSRETTGMKESSASAMPGGLKIRWDDSNMRSAYANVCNVASTREEVVLLFGMNQAWNAQQKEVTVQLTDRIVLSPYAAKRLATLLPHTARQHESPSGPLDTPGRRSADTAVK